MKKYIGIDIGGTTLLAGIIDQKGKVLKKIILKTNINNYEIPLIEIVKKAALKIKKISETNNIKIKGIGISAAGQIDHNKGIVIGDNGFIPNWKGTNIKKELEEITELDVIVNNDANCAAIAEKWLGNGQDYNDLIVYTIGTGIGAGIILNNQLIYGKKGLAGEIGHMIINHQGKNCTCGNSGCFEQYGSITALINEVKKNSNKKEEIIDGKYIFEEAKKGNKELLNYVKNFINYHCSAIISLIHIFNPEAIIIGGGVSLQKEYLIEPIRRIVKEKVMSAFLENFVLKTAKLSNEAGMIGSVKLYIDKTEL